MIGKMRIALKIIATVLVIGIILWYMQIDRKETSAQRAIVQEVKGQIWNCRSAGNNITIHGKVLVWDMRNDSRSSAYGKLPDNIRAKSTDKPITVFMVVGERNEQVGTYSHSGQPAYRQYMEIAVSSWPDKKPIGFYSVVSKDPPSSRQVRQSPEYGDPNEPIANWIKSLSGL